MQIKKGDKVVVLAGKDKKKIGDVIEINRSSNRAKISYESIEFMLSFLRCLIIFISTSSKSIFVNKISTIWNLICLWFIALAMKE